MTPAAGKVRDEYEIVSLRFSPSAGRAFGYGVEHFSASNGAAYDVNLAQYFFLRARALDPNYPYVNHELARISFLRGELDAALTDIDLQISEHGDSEPNAYYVRGLIEGYKGDYPAAVADYAHFLTFDPHNWAAINDYAWVLLKAQDYDTARAVTSSGLQYFPDNAWLLNSYATALFETGDLQGALSVAKRAQVAAGKVTMAEWLQAYPGNDPGVAAQGVAALQNATADNIHNIELKLASSTVQSN